MTLRSQENKLPSAPERGETEQVRAGSSSLVNAAPSMGHREEAAGKQSAPEMGNRKSSARNSGSARGGITGVEATEAWVSPVASFLEQLAVQLEEAEAHIALAGNRFDIVTARRRVIDVCRRIGALESGS